MLDRLESIEKRYEQLNQLMTEPEVVADHERLQALAREQAAIEELVTKYREYKKTEASIEATQSMRNDGLDEEMTTLVKQELETLTAHRDEFLKSSSKDIRVLSYRSAGVPMGNGSFRLEVRHGTCVDCNQCGIATTCPADAFYRSRVNGRRGGYTDDKKLPKGEANR